MKAFIQLLVLAVACKRGVAEELCLVSVDA